MYALTIAIVEEAVVVVLILLLRRRPLLRLPIFSQKDKNFSYARLLLRLLSQILLSLRIPCTDHRSSLLLLLVAVVIIMMMKLS